MLISQNTWTKNYQTITEVKAEYMEMKCSCAVRRCGPLNCIFAVHVSVCLFFRSPRSLYVGNISSGNQPHRANYENFNLNHTILIHGRTHERWEGRFAKFMGGGRDDLQRCFCKSPLPSPLSALLDQHHVSQVEVFIVFTERLVFT
jgi:hypothetical protein